MTSDWNDADELEAEEVDDDPGFLGGGSIAETMGGDADDELDEHGDNLSSVDEEEL